MQLTQEHQELRRNLTKFIDNEINPHVEEWEAAEIFPAHDLFKKMGNLGFLGLTKPEDFGGMGLGCEHKNSRGNCDFHGNALREQGNVRIQDVCRQFTRR